MTSASSRWRLRPEAPAGARRSAVRLGVALVLLGAVCAALAITAATVWRVPTTATSTARLGGPGAAVTAPGVLAARSGAVTITATGEGLITAGIGSTGDVTAWLDADPPVSAARLTGFDGEDVVVQPPEPTTPAVPSSARSAPSAAGSDLLVTRVSGEGSVRLTHQPSAGDLLLVTSDTAALDEVTLTWSVLVDHPAALPVGVLAGVLVATGLALLAVVRRGAGGPRLPRAPRARPAPVARVPAAADHGATARVTTARGATTRPTGVEESVPRPSLAVALAVVIPAAVAGCGAPPQVLAPPSPAPAPAGPAVTAEQLARIVDGPEGVAVTVAAADVALDAEALTARVDGAALAVRRADYTIAAAGAPAPGSAPAPAGAPEAGAAPHELRAVGGERLLEAVPAAGPWPRFVLTVSGGGERPRDGDAAGVLPAAPAAVPVLEVLTQVDPRAPYKLVASTGLLPGATFPPLTQSAGAVEPLPPDGGDLRLPPALALTQLADLLTGGGGDVAGVFAASPFTTGVLAERDAETAAGAPYLTRTSTHTPREGAVWAVRTEDGGAVVVGVLDAVRTFDAGTSGADLSLPVDVAALAGTDTATAGSITTAETVVLTVPPAGSDEQVTVVGAQRAFTTVTLD